MFRAEQQTQKASRKLVGEDFLFFRPVFNVADAAISVGVGIILVFQKRFFPTPKKEENVQEDTVEPTTQD